jgi:thiamine pyrophosphate-dependent acetolactate synthase large subunit-like protein
VEHFRPLTKWTTRVGTGAVIPEVIHKTFKVASPGAGNVEVPEDVAAEALMASRRRTGRCAGSSSSISPPAWTTTPSRSSHSAFSPTSALMGRDDILVSDVGTHKLWVARASPGLRAEHGADLERLRRDGLRATGRGGQR